MYCRIGGEQGAVIRRVQVTPFILSWHECRHVEAVSGLSEVSRDVLVTTPKPAHIMDLSGTHIFDVLIVTEPGRTCANIHQYMQYQSLVFADALLFS